MLKDLNFLRKEFDLSEFEFKLNPKKNVPFSFVKQLLFLLKNCNKTKIYIIQFAGYNSLLPVIFSKILKKKSVIVLGGTDCVSFPSISYGNFHKKLLGLFTSLSIKNCDLLLPVDSSLIEYDYNYQKNDFPKQGYKYHCPDITTKNQVIYNGFETDKWLFSKNKEENTFVTIVAGLSNFSKIQLKGIDLIIQLAYQFPTFKFYVVGGENLQQGIPDNIILKPFVPNNELSNFLNSKEFYLQLSMSEGFPNALCEAMLCGCIPIVTAVGAMPKIVSEIGFVLNKKDPILLSEIVQKATGLTKNDREQLAEKSRDRIKNVYPIIRREKEFINAIYSIYN